MRITHCYYMSCLIGASSGIGAATAVHFAKLGYHLALCGRNMEALSDVKAKCLLVNKSLADENVIQTNFLM